MDFYKLTPLTIALASALPAFAATPPDAGRTLQENTPVIEQPKSSQEIKIEVPVSTEVTPGGIEATVQSITFNGNTRFSQEVLRSTLGDVAGKSYDLAGLRNLANQITAHYHTQGFPFARAYLPAQTFKDGQLQINIIEGLYGDVKSISEEDKLSNGAQKFLSSLVKGDVIQNKPLERAVLLIDDLPGIKATPLVRPGQQVGTGDLDVRVERDKRFGGEVSLDNYGNRYTGKIRGRASLHINSPFTFGDQISISGLYTEEDMWYGSLGYSLPLGGSGLRANIGYAHTYYELGKQFSALDASGTAKISSAGLSYPIIRTQRANLTASATYQHKNLHDEQDSTSLSDRKSSDSLPITLGFDLRDNIAGGGVTYGSISWTHGNLDLDNGLEVADRITAKTEGDFDKVNLDLARLQLLPRNFSLYGRLSAQWAGDNLDSSEGFGLGGQSGVRAYPSGEGFGDEGWLTQIELRYAANFENGANLSPYAFYDSGRVRINHNTWQAGDNHRSITGAGLGLRATHGKWSGDAAIAWRAYGGKPESDTQSYDPRLWVGLAYKY